MDNNELRTLKILEEIDSNDSINQRVIAGNLNISLGLTNSFIKRLAKKGYIKVTTIPKNRIIYLLTPKGVSEKTRLTYDYIKLSFTFYKNTRDKMISLFDKNSKEGVKKISFYGVSEIAEIAYISLKETSIEFVGIYDNKEGVFMGESIKNILEIDSQFFDKIFITDSEINSDNLNILKKNVENSKIVKL